MKDYPTVFISYAWEESETPRHKEWVLNLANKLIHNGVEVNLDQYNLNLGENIQYFIQQSMNNSDYILVICTPIYKKKAESLTGGVAPEISMINNYIFNNMANNGKILPLLRRGNGSESIPSFLTSFIYADFRNDENFDSNLTKLLRSLYKEPEVVKPRRGQRPNFEKTSSSSTSAKTKEEQETPKSEKKSAKGIIESLIAKGEIKKALEEMKRLAEGNGDLKNNIIIIFARLNSLQKRINIGTVGEESVSVERRRISYSMLSLLDKF